MWFCVRERAGAGAQIVADTQGGCWAATAARNQAHLLREILRNVHLLLRGFRVAAAAAECEHPAELYVQEGAQARGHIHGVKYVRAMGKHLAEPGTTMVLEGGGCVAGTDHLHTAFGCCGTHHGIELLVLQPGGSDTCYSRRSDIMKTHQDTSACIQHLIRPV